MSKFYVALLKTVDKICPNSIRPFWEHPAGPKTVYFWAPTFKWGLVIAGIGDLQRPAEKISINQSAVLFTTGCIWSRYSTIITPFNTNMLMVNLFVALSQSYQMIRAYKYKMDHPEE